MRPQPGPVAVLASILCFWCHIAAAELPSTFYIYSESQQDTQSDTGAAVENYYSFYKGLVACADNPVALFLDNQDVNEVAASSARCDGCTQPLVPDSDDPITQFEWLDKSDAAEWGHYSLSLSTFRFYSGRLLLDPYR